ncbi:hypothetical protein U9M48_018054 [Paspalum notatum var. saurae]|uniref:Uncharacterized protein n=1 Tax=Paspalum notatum var. saurae TaxID=547442 RepID=A0AAQ3WPF3_PASNO
MVPPRRGDKGWPVGKASGEGKPDARRRPRRQRSACGDFVNLEMSIQPSSTKVLIGVRCACVVGVNVRVC